MGKIIEREVDRTSGKRRENNENERLFKKLISSTLLITARFERFAWVSYNNAQAVSIELGMLQEVQGQLDTASDVALPRKYTLLMVRPLI